MVPKIDVGCITGTNIFATSQPVWVHDLETGSADYVICHSAPKWHLVHYELRRLSTVACLLSSIKYNLKLRNKHEIVSLISKYVLECVVKLWDSYWENFLIWCTDVNNFPKNSVPFSNFEARYVHHAPPGFTLKTSTFRQQIAFMSFVCHPEKKIAIISQYII
jgi:hypothetical protein